MSAGILRLSRPAALRCYVAALCLAAATAWWLLARGQEPLFGGGVPWWAIAAGFIVAELCVVHIEFRRSAHSLAMADIPFVLGLVFASGSDFALGAALGAGLVLRVPRRSPLIRTVFNAAQVGLAA